MPEEGTFILFEPQDNADFGELWDYSLQNYLAHAHRTPKPTCNSCNRANQATTAIRSAQPFAEEFTRLVSGEDRNGEP